MKRVLIAALLVAPFTQAATVEPVPTERVINQVCNTGNAQSTADCMSTLKSIVVSAYGAGRFEGICDASRTQDLEPPCAALIDNSREFELLHRWYGEVKATLKPLK